MVGGKIYGPFVDQSRSDFSCVDIARIGHGPGCGWRYGTWRARRRSSSGPVGAVVGGAVGAVTGGVAGVLGIDQRPRFRQYVVEQHHPSFHYREPVHVGVVLPDSGLTYYEVPAEYGAPHYRYTVVNDQTVLVNPRTHSVVEIID